MQETVIRVTRQSAAVLLTTAFLLCLVSCSGKKTPASSASSGPGYRDYLGEFAYDLPAACMVWEPVEGEKDESGNPVYGIQYREIKDLDKLLASNDTAFLLYFHASAYGEDGGITAVVEEIAERLAGKITVVTLDAGQFSEMVSKYQLKLLPEFVLHRSGAEDKVFGTSDRGSWTMQEVADWLAESGYSMNGG